jgi:nudix-type nucleoside diphosphatase (YffH/AdpP family)
MPQVTILSRAKVYKSFFDIDEVELQFGDNTVPIKRSLVATRKACGVLLHNIDNNTFIFSKQYRVGAIDDGNPYVIEIPAGIMDKDETPEECARREVLEETGYGVESLQKIGSFFNSPGYTNEKINLFYCTTRNKLKHQTGGGLDSEHEFIEILEFPIEKAYQMRDTGEICDAKTVIALYWFENQAKA